MGRLAALLLAGLFLLSGCVGERGTIVAISREEGSGTRGAFTQLTGVADHTGDRTAITSEITNSTAVMLATVAGNPYAVGYVSMGVLEGAGVKALPIDGAPPTPEAVAEGSYPLSRPFYVAAAPDLSPAGEDFLRFLLSDQGQAVVVEAGYISPGSSGPYRGGASGRVVVAGSSSVAPVMERLGEAYTARNPAVSIELQQNDSTTGLSAAAEGICHLAMSSRALTEEELAALGEPSVLAVDGIAVIVSPDNPCQGLSTRQVRGIYLGEITRWEELAGP